MPTSLIAPILGAGVSYGLGKLFGGSGDAPKVNATPAGFNAGGLKATFAGNGYDIKPSAARLGAVGQVAGTFSDLASATGALRQTVTPGMSDLRKARLEDLTNTSTAAIGNLRDNLARRRILGSSFAQDALARADKEFMAQRDAVTTDSYLKELEATNQLTQQEYAARRSRFQTGLDELNLEASIAANLAGTATKTLGSAAETQAKLDAQASAGNGSLIGQLVQPIGKAVGAGAGSFFPSGGGGVATTMNYGGQSWPSFA